MSKWEEKRLEDIIDVNPPVKLKKGESYPFIDIDKVYIMYFNIPLRKDIPLETFDLPQYSRLFVY